MFPRGADGALLLCLILGWFVLVFFHRARSPFSESWIELGLIRALLPERDVPFKIPNPEGRLEFGSRYWIFTFFFFFLLLVFKGVFFFLNRVYSGSLNPESVSNYSIT